MVEMFPVAQLTFNTPPKLFPPFWIYGMVLAVGGFFSSVSSVCFLLKETLADNSLLGWQKQGQILIGRCRTGSNKLVGQVLGGETPQHKPVASPTKIFFLAGFPPSS